MEGVRNEQLVFVFPIQDKTMYTYIILRISVHIQCEQGHIIIFALRDLNFFHIKVSGFGFRIKVTASVALVSRYLCKPYVISELFKEIFQR